MLYEVITELRSDTGELLGFLRITLEERKMLAAHTEYQQTLFERCVITSYSIHYTKLYDSQCPRLGISSSITASG